MATTDSLTRYQAPEAVAKWVRACGFRTNREAAVSLFISERTFYRLQREGLPTGGRGRLLAERMALVASARKSG